ncbi:MAG: platelet-activating factor acetylhydrolase IB subunit [Pirellulales bacterium]
MFFTRCLHIAIVCSFVVPASAHAENVVQAAIKNATTPAHRMKSDEKNWWQERHESKAIEAKKNKWDIIFLGDSITHSWETAGKKTWNKYYQKRRALNLGFSGDRTEHVLWRLDNGEFEEVQPKVVVLMIGTNNTGHRKDPPKAIAAGVEKIIERINTKSPKTKILLLAIFPRSEKVSDPQRKNNDRANALIKQLTKKDGVTYLDINERFLLPDGTLSKEIMPDLLHPKQKGYAIWAEAIEPSLRTLLAEDS